MNMSVKHIIISGRVQGVGFRQYVLLEARKLGLRGWVRNLWDGRVEVLVKLEMNNESEFLAALKRGPALSRVSDCVVNDLTADTELEVFAILNDGRSLYEK
jgi:acylphosphatase